MVCSTFILKVCNSASANLEGLILVFLYVKSHTITSLKDKKFAEHERKIFGAEFLAPHQKWKLVCSFVTLFRVAGLNTYYIFIYVHIYFPGESLYNCLISDTRTSQLGL